MLGGFAVIITPSLPDHLHIGSEQFIQVALYAAVDRAGSQATADYQYRFLFRRKTEESQRFLFPVGRFFQILADRVSGNHNLVGRKELLHTVVGDTYLRCFLCQQFIGYSGIRVLLLYQGRDAQRSRHPQRRATGIAAHSHCNVRTKLADRLLRQSEAFTQTVEHFYIVEQVGTVETTHR